MTTIVSWLIRYGHVLGAAIWVSGYALLAFFMIPLLGKEPNEILGSKCDELTDFRVKSEQSVV